MNDVVQGRDLCFCNNVTKKTVELSFAGFSLLRYEFNPGSIKAHYTPKRVWPWAICSLCKAILTDI